MRALVVMIALAGCMTDDSGGGDGDGDTLGYGTLTNVEWGGALCPAGFSCAGSLQIGASDFTGKIAGGDVIARGNLTESTRAAVADLVAAIKLSEPTGVFEADGGDAGRVEYDVLRGS